MNKINEQRKFQLLKKTQT